jgi:hypothetical protein
MNAKRYQIGSCLLVAGIFLSLLALASPAAARNPNLSNWTINLSGDEPPTETWHDYCQEIEVVGSTVHVTYWNYGDSNRLYYRRSTDGGQTWEAKILLYDTNPGGSTSTVQRGWKYLAVDGTSVHVAYAAYDSTAPGYNCKLIYRRSTNNGASFEAARPLAPTSGGWWWIGPTRIAASSGKVTIAISYQAFDGAWQALATLNSADAGSNFTTNAVATSGDRYLGVPVGDLKRLGNRIYLLYRQDLEQGEYGAFNTALHCATSLDGGPTFTDNLMTTVSTSGKYLSYDVQEASYSPNIALDGDKVYVVWTQNDTSYNSSNDRSLYIRSSGDQGLTFGAPQKLAQNQTGGIADMQLGQETVSAKGGYVYVVFMTSDGTVYLRRSSDNGASFFPLQTMGTGTWWPNLVVDPANGAKVHVFWWATYRYSADGGATFTSPVVLMPWAGCSGNQTGVQMALGPNDTKHFVNSFQYYTAAYGWGDRDIFYRCFPPAPAPSAGNRALRTYSDANEYRYDSMEVASSDWFNFGSQMSAEVWVKPLPADIYWRPIFAKLPINITPAGSTSRLFSIGTEARGAYGPRAIAELATTDGWNVLDLGWYDPSVIVPDNVWTHLAMTYDAGAAGNNFKLYKNGQLIISARAIGNVATGTGNFFAGDIWPAYNGGWEMTELRLWSKTLSQNDIKANMYRKLAGTESGLNAYYQFGNTTKDLTGHGNDGILNYKESYVSATLGSPSLSAVNGLLLE